MCLLTRNYLPVLYQLLPDDFPHDLRADAQQLGNGGVRVVEAVQQNLGHLSLLLSVRNKIVTESIDLACLNGVLD